MAPKKPPAPARARPGPAPSDEADRHRQVSHSEPGSRRAEAESLAEEYGVSESRVWQLACDLERARRMLEIEREEHARAEARKARVR